MWKQWLSAYPGRIAGAVAGFVLGLIYLFVGFWDMLVFAFLISVGYAIGKRLETGEGSLMPFSRVAQLIESWIGRQRPFR